MFIIYKFKKIRIRLLYKIMILVSLVVTTCLALAIFLFIYFFDSIMNEHFSERALHVADSVAQNQQVIDALTTENPDLIIQPISETIRNLTGASYVVVGNKEGIRYSHHDPNQIGKVMGTSNDIIFDEKEAITYRDVGVSGEATKAKTPIFDRRGEVIGVSSVGFLLTDIEEEVSGYLKLTVQLFSIVLLIGFIGAFIVARMMKKMFFGIEPEQIAFLFKEKEAILESMHDAIIAVNSSDKIVSINKKARSISYFDQFNIGSNFQDSKIYKTVNKYKDVGGLNPKIMLDKSAYIMDYSPILQEGHLEGSIFTFRPVSEIEQLTKEFAEINYFADNMRAQNHEFLNKLNTIYGLLVLNNTEDAIQLISKEVSQRQEFVTFLIESVNNPLIAACLLGKQSRAAEFKIQLLIDEESEMQVLPKHIEEQEIVTVIGNLIENAIEAAYQKNGTNGIVKVSFTDLGPDIIFEFEDNGRGVFPHEEKKIFQDGYSTKNSGKNNGIGLVITQNALEKLKGNIYVCTSELGGARFTITIPKKIIGGDKDDQRRFD